MKRREWVGLAAVLVVAMVAMPVSFAGDKDKYKCTHTTQACLDEMAAHLKKAGWLGVELDTAETGEMTVKRVVPGSPAEAAGFKVGDVLVALNDLKYGDKKNKEAFMAANVPGNEVTITVTRGGMAKKLAVTLGQRPAEVIAQQVGHHMLEHAGETAIAKN